MVPHQRSGGLKRPRCFWFLQRHKLQFTTKSFPFTANPSFSLPLAFTKLYLRLSQAVPMSEAYEGRGVSSRKTEVRRAANRMTAAAPTVSESTFCRLLPDHLVGSADHLMALHADTAGSKPVLAYLYWRETGDMSVWPGIIQDAIVMNTDDLACVGMTDNFICSATLSRNRYLVPVPIVEYLIAAGGQFVDWLNEMGIAAWYAGGETADVGDIVRTLDVGYTVAARIAREQLITIEPQVGDVIVGLASDGQTTYETIPNSGIGSNGLTSARHDLLSRHYADYFPESFDPLVPPHLAYVGRWRLTERPEADGPTVGELLLSPTRTYLPVLRAVLSAHSASIRGIVHNTGGGQTKCLRYIGSGLHVIKDNLFAPPPVFRLIQEALPTNWREMYGTFNMGSRMEIYTDRQTAEQLIAICSSFNLRAQVVGRFEAIDGPSRLTVVHEGAEYVYAE